MSEQAAICIGGPLDGTVVKDIALALVRGLDVYTLECVYVEKQPIIYFYVYAELSTTAALHSVFAAYAKKGEK